ncbi:hypothetical protein [Flavobacterium sp.]|uniref:hypothetical protein n=1 Tax=Flavobacterium sp. TaxID=239 RepID=UPI00391B4E66
MTPKEKKYLTIGVSAVAGISVLILLTRKKTETGTYSEPTGNGTVNAPTFNAVTVMNKLLNAMKTTGTDEAAIFKALTNVNQTQFGQVVKAFGIRQYNSTMGNQINYFPVYQLPYVNLKGWLENELSDENYSSLQKKYPNYL